MPHLTVEYTSNLNTFDAGVTLLQLNQALLQSGHFEEIDIKSRAIALDTFQVGTTDSRAFIHVKCSILTGRTTQVKHALAQSLLQVLQNTFNTPSHLHLQLCVEILEIDRETYAKTTLPAKEN